MTNAVQALPQAARWASLPSCVFSIWGVGVEGITFSLTWQRLPVHPGTHLIRRQGTAQLRHRSDEDAVSTNKAKYGARVVRLPSGATVHSKAGPINY